MQIAEAFVEVRAKTDKVEEDIEKGVTSAAQKGGDAGGKAMSSGLLTGANDAVGKLTSLFAGLRFAQSLGDAVEKASDLNEAVSLSKQVFGDAAAGIEKIGDTSATQFGISKRAFLEASSGLDNLLVNLGYTSDQAAKTSVDLVRMASDLGSAFNKDPAEALAALQSALIGETEPIRQFGVILNEATIKQKALELGLYDGKGALEANAKAQATLALITEGTSRVQGDFQRTSDGLANSERIAAAQREDAAASMGANFLPVYKAAVKLVGELATAFGALPAPIQTGIIALAGIAALSGPIRIVVDVVKGLGQAAINAGKSLVGMGAVLGPLTAIVGLATIAYIAYTGKKAEARAETLKFVTALNDEAEGHEGSVNSLIASQLETDKWRGILSKTGFALSDVAGIVKGEANPAYDALSKRVNELWETQGRSEVTTRKISEEFGINGKAAFDLVEKVDGLRATYSNATDEVERHNAAQRDVNLSMNDAAAAQSAFEARVSSSAAALNGATVGTQEYNDSQMGLVDTVAAAEEAVANETNAINDLTNALLAMFDSNFAVIDAQRSFKEATDKASLAASSSKTTAEEQAVAYEDVEKAALKVANANIKKAQDEAIANGASAESVNTNKIVIDTLNFLASTASGPVAEALRGMVAQLQVVDKQRPKPTVDLEKQLFDSKVGDAQRASDALDKKRPKPILDAQDNASGKAQAAGGAVDEFDRKVGTATISVNDQASAQIRNAIALGQQFAGSSYVADVGTKRTGARASGGPVWPGTWLVGEGGPEILHIEPGGRGEVINARETKARLSSGGGGVIVNGDINVGTREDLRAMSGELDRNLWLAKNGGSR